MSKSVFSKIFSINDYNETHKIIYILGLKIKFPKSEYAKKQKANPYEYYKKNNIDITQIPPATGQIRDIQLANFELLKELDYVCKQNNLTYWIDFGTLLGAVRHKGFIPWDDDIDTGMLRPDYEKLFEVFDKTTRNPELYLRVSADRKNNIILKVSHKKCPYIFVDIFTYDKCEELYLEKESNLHKRIKNINHANLAKTETFYEIAREIKDLNNKIYPDIGKDKNCLVYGLEHIEPYKNWIFAQKIFFPLTELEFEGVKIPAPNNYEVYLRTIYGDFMSYPKKFGMGHTMYLNLSEEQCAIIRNLGKVK